jgi:hypothetical protein
MAVLAAILKNRLDVAMKRGRGGSVQRDREHCQQVVQTAHLKMKFLVYSNAERGGVGFYFLRLK